MPSNTDTHCRAAIKTDVVPGTLNLVLLTDKGNVCAPVLLQCSYNTGLCTSTQKLVPLDSMDCSLRGNPKVCGNRQASAVSSAAWEAARASSVGSSDLCPRNYGCRSEEAPRLESRLHCPNGRIPALHPSPFLFFLLACKYCWFLF